MVIDFLNSKKTKVMTAREAKDLAKKRVLNYLISSGPMSSVSLKHYLKDVDVEYALNSLQRDKFVIQIPVDKTSYDYTTAMKLGGRPKSQWKPLRMTKL